jgi:hypothetical protein
MWHLAFLPRYKQLAKNITKMRVTVTGPYLNNLTIKHRSYCWETLTNMPRKKGVVKQQCKKSRRAAKILWAAEGYHTAAKKPTNKPWTSEFTTYKQKVEYRDQGYSTCWLRTSFRSAAWIGVIFVCCSRLRLRVRQNATTCDRRCHASSICFCGA